MDSYNIDFTNLGPVEYDDIGANFPALNSNQDAISALNSKIELEIQQIKDEKIRSMSNDLNNDINSKEKSNQKPKRDNFIKINESSIDSQKT